MDSCPTTRRLGLLLVDDDGPLSGPDRLHVRACARCRAELDALSDDPGLRAWAGDRAARPDPIEIGPGLARVLDAAADGPPDGPARRAPPGLGPPRRAGDLGALGPYLIEAELGRGGMGVVYRACDEALRRRVAVKVLLGDPADVPGRRRLVREARAAARLRHDHVVAIHAVVDDGEGPALLVMEYIEGPNLARLIQREGRLGPRRAAEIVAQAADGLAAAHAIGLIHRDVKPANILVESEGGRARITDFGLARMPEGSASLTRDSILAGTPSYMSPEQARGEACDARSDVYALGATLYEALVGEPPFRGSPAMVLRQVLDEDPRPPRRLDESIPIDLETIGLKAMAKEPARRYATAAELADDLRRWLRGEPIAARPVGAPGRAVRWCRRNRRVAALGATVLVLLAAVAVGSALAAWRIAREKGAAVAAGHLAEQKAEAARAHFDLALESLDRLVGDVQARLGTRAGTLDLRRGLMTTARDGLERLAKAAESTASTDRALALAYDRLGDLEFELGRTPQSVAAYERSLRAAGARSDASPSDREARRDVARARDKLGLMAMRAFRHPEAGAHFAVARETRERLLAEAPADPVLLRDLAVSLGNVGDQAQATKRFEAARDAYLGAIRSNDEALARGGDRTASLLSDALLRGKLADTFMALYDWKAAGEHAAKAADSARLALATDPDDPSARRRLVNTLDRVGNVKLRTADYAGAEAVFREGLALRERLAADDPASAEARRNVVVSHHFLGDAHIRLGRLDDARDDFLAGLAISERLAADDPGSLQKATDMGLAYYKLADVEERARRYDAALVWTRRVEDLIRRAFAAGLIPEAIYREQLAIAAGALSRQDAGARGFAGPETPPLLGLRGLDEVRRGEVDRAAATADALRSLAPHDPSALLDCARIYAQCARLTPPRPADLAARRGHLLDEALRCLRDHRRDGPPPEGSLVDPDLDPLRERPVFLKPPAAAR